MTVMRRDAPALAAAVRPAARAAAGASAVAATGCPGSRIGYVYVLPFFLVFLAFSVYPWLDTAWVSLHDTRLSTYDQSSWIGLDNYREPVHQPVLLERVPQHDHDRDHLDRPAAVHGARASRTC